MLLPVALVFAFVAVVMAVQGGAAVFFSSRDRNERVNRRLTLLAQGMSPEDVYAALVRKPKDAATGRVTPDLYDRFFLYCRQAGVEISPERLVGLVIIAAVLLWIGALVLLSVVSGRAALLNVLLSLLGAVALSVMAASLWLTSRHAARLRALETQLPLALDVVTRAIRAGHPVIASVQLATEELGDPIGSEFGLVVDETTYGLEFKEALLNFARRTGSPDAHFFAVSVGIQSETGGNLAEILVNLANVIRARQTLHLRVRALASEGRMSAIVLSVLPVLLVGWILLTQPGTYSDVIADPLFWPSVAVLAVLYITGQVIMNSIVNFKY
jgi:tight adherence protein B